jgi:hypothetical protein
MNLSETTARSNARKAWVALGKAREARSTSIYLSGTNAEVYATVMRDYTRDMVRIARGYMHNAILYRTEVL